MNRTPNRFLQESFMNHRFAVVLMLALTSAAATAQSTTASSALSQQVHAQRVQRLAENLRSRRGALGLGQSDSLETAHSWQDAQGTSIARFHQTWQGFRVFGAGLTASVSPSGAVQTLGSALEPRIEVAGKPVVTEEQARLVSHRELLPRGPYAALPTTELVVFPTRFTGGRRTKMDAQGHIVWDREGSVLAPRPQGTHVWAYEVASVLNNRLDGVRELHVIVDARTGDVLRKWDAATTVLPRTQARAPRTYGDLQLAKAPLQVAPSFLTPESGAVPQTAAPGVNPAIGTGHSQYSGNVNLGTVTNANGGFDLRDMTRALNTNSVWLNTGIATSYFDILSAGFTAVPYAMNNQAGSLNDTWGDGANYVSPPPNEPNDFYTPAVFHWGDANGQTAAVDAHFAATSTYDMYRNVLGRLGLDGNDAGVFSVVHFNFLYDNASWINSIQAMTYGDGSYPYNPGGFKSLTTLDIGGHEMSHGVMASTANLDYFGESGGLNEANSDMMAQSVVAYSTRAAGDPLGTIPAATQDWTLGEKAAPDGTPLRWMYKPSLDGTSPDAWFYGMDLLDVHFTSGPGNRLFYFLSQGADSDPTSARYSPYLPGGMTGIGIDKATRVWYKGMSEQFTNTSNYHDARAGVLTAAAALYGASSNEYAAVENAFAAINVGPAHGQPERPVVTFPTDLISLDSPVAIITQGTALDSVFNTTPVVPAGSVLALKVNVAHANDPSVSWQAGIAPGFFSPTQTPLNVTASNGSFDAQGLFHAPLEAPIFCGVRAFSVQDPLQFAATMIYTAHMDADGDTEQDALDAGMLALLWHIKSSVTTQISPYPDPEQNGSVDDMSVQLWVEAFNNAFGQ
jgi:Zn-dependent metalloprotease